MSTSKYPKLAQFLGGYFHQDWTEEAENSEEVLKTFRAGAGSKKLRELVDELDALLAEKLKEKELAKRLSELGSCCDPAAEGRTHGEWVKWIRGVLGAPKGR